MDQKQPKQSYLQDFLPLLPQQQGMLYQYLGNPDPKLLNEINAYHLFGRVSESVIRKTWERLIESNDILRTVFRWEKLREPVQVVLKERSIPIKIETVVSQLDVDDQVNHLCRELRQTAYDLRKETVRIVLLLHQPDHAVMIVANHHILFDGWSNAVLMSGFKKTYEAILSGTSPERSQAGAYCHLVREIMCGETQTFSGYWRHYLKLLPSMVSSISCGHKNEVHTTTLSHDAAVSVEQAARRYEVSPAVLYYFAWAMVLHFKNKESRPAFGITFSGRGRLSPALANTPCLLIKTLPLLVDTRDEFTLGGCLNKIKSDLIEHQAQEPNSLIALYDELEFSSAALYESVAVVQNYPMNYQDYQNGALRMEICRREYDSHLDLNISIRQFSELQVDLEYNTLKYSNGEVRLWMEWFETVLEFVGQAQDQTLGAFVSILNLQDRNCPEMIGEFNL